MAVPRPIRLQPTMHGCQKITMRLKQLSKMKSSNSYDYCQSSIGNGMQCHWRKPIESHCWFLPLVQDGINNKDGSLMSVRFISSKYRSINRIISLEKNKCDTTPIIPQKFQLFQYESSSHRNFSLRKDEPQSALPTLDASAILNPGKFCKQTVKGSVGSISGIAAAKRLVDGRRQFLKQIHDELGPIGLDRMCERSKITEECTPGYLGTELKTKKYELTGHGVPNGLLSHLLRISGTWTLSLVDGSSRLGSRRRSTSGRQQITVPDPSTTPQKVELNFRSASDTILLDRNQILFTCDTKETVPKEVTKTTTTNLEYLPKHWEHDLEMYIVVMDRIASRLAAVVFSSISPSQLSTSAKGQPLSGEESGEVSLSYDNSKIKQESCYDTNFGNGSVVTPAQLQKWNAKVTTRETLPANAQKLTTVGLVDTIDEHRKCAPVLTIEWTFPRCGSSCSILLCLRDSNADDLGEETGTDDQFSITRKVEAQNLKATSLVFEGTYLPS